MTGEEYSEAEKKYGPIIEMQQKTHQELKQCRNELNQQKEIIKQTVTDQDKKKAEEKLSIQKAKYNQVRYPAKHLLKENVQMWKNSYENYCKQKNFANYKERTNRAIDVIAPHIINNEISFEDLLNGKKINTILQKYVDKSTISSDSKVRYLLHLRAMITFLASNNFSPEYPEENDTIELSARNIKLMNVNQQFETFIEGLKRKSNDEASTETETITEAEITEIITKCQDKLVKLRGNEMNETNAISFRDNLVVLCTIRLGRRSLEICKMTIKEFLNAETCLTEHGSYKHIEVLMTKNRTKNKDKALIGLSLIEYDHMTLSSYKFKK